MLNYKIYIFVYLNSNIIYYVHTASVFVQYGGADFDASSGTHTLSSLLEGLPTDAVLTHSKLLCGVIGNNKIENLTVTEDENDEDEENISNDVQT
jgi:hypothetical protein